MINLIKNFFKPSADFAKLVKEGALIIDVRTAAEYGAGHIEGSGNIPLDKLKGEIRLLKQADKPIITVCRSGSRSGMAKSILKSAGLEVYNGGTWTNLKKKIQ